MPNGRCVAFRYTPAFIVWCTMPRFRFQWHHISDDLREILAKNAHLDGSDVQHFVNAFGKRPSQEFVRILWPILLDHWLTYYAIHAARVALALRNHHLGDPSVIDDVSYLHTCRNTRRLREVVLREFIDFGEHPAHIEFSTSNRSLKPQSEGTSVQSNAEVSPVDVLRRHVYLLIQTHFPKNHTTRTADGSVLMAYGSSVLCVSIASDPITVRVSANLLTQVVPTAQLYETLNHINHELPLGRMYAVNNLVVLEASIPPIAIEEKMLLYTIANLAHIADIYDDRLQRSFGGDVSGIAVAGDVIDV